jgi:predicted regulator of Ras-like GTPase activity (Roadblock/LC7/MglB family)
MSNMVRTRFASLLRNLLRRMDPEDEPAEDAPRPVAGTAPLAPAAPATPPATPPNGRLNFVRASVPPNANEIAVPLAPIVASLPMDLRGKIMTVPPPGLTINLPVETVTTQLAFGAVKISFGELRELAPGIFANAASALDNKLINLPLGEILPRLNPTLLARREASKVEVAADINGPFGGRADGIVFTTQPLKAPSTTTPPLPVRPATPAPAPLRVNQPVAPPKPAPATFTPTPTFQRSMPAAPVSPATPTPAPARVNLPVIPPTPVAPIAFAPPPGLQRTVTPTPPTPPVRAVTPAPVVQPFAFTQTPAPAPVKLTPAPAPPAPAMPAAPAPAVPAPEPTTIFATLWDLAEYWPEELKDEISRYALANISVPLSGDAVEAGLKRGRVTMSWRELRSLARPSSPASPNDQLELDLPLKVIAPLFLAAQKNSSAAKRKATVSEEIPNLFFGFPQSAPEPTVASAPPPVMPAPVAPKPVEKKTSDSNFFTWNDTSDTPKTEEAIYSPPPVPQTDFSHRFAPPKEVVARAAALPGVAGAVITLPDGLRVASEVPAEFNADTLAAFIPQIFERMNQSARELRMGALNNVSFTVGNVPWRIIRVNAVYLAAFGRAGESLPAAALTALAGELDRKKTP